MYLIVCLFLACFMPPPSGFMVVPFPHSFLHILCSFYTRVFAFYFIKKYSSVLVHRSAPPTGVAKRRDRQRTCAGRALNCGIVEATTGKTRRYQVPKRPNTPYKTKHYKWVGRTRSSIEFGWAQQDVTKPQRSWVGVGRDAVGALGRLPWVGHRER